MLYLLVCVVSAISLFAAGKSVLFIISAENDAIVGQRTDGHRTDQSTRTTAGRAAIAVHKRRLTYFLASSVCRF